MQGFARQPHHYTRQYSYGEVTLAVTESVSLP